MRILKPLVHSFGKWYCNAVCRREFEKQQFERLNERAVEYAFVFRHLAGLYPRTVLDVGSGTSALPSLIRTSGFLVTAIDNVTDYWSSSMHNRHFHVLDDDITNTRLKTTYDFITCISVLEHVKAHAMAAANMVELLAKNGHLALTFPYNEGKYVRDVYRTPGAGYGQKFPFIAQVFSRNEIDGWLTGRKATIVDQEYWQFWEGEFWTFGRQVLPPRKVTKDERHQLTCLLICKDS